MKRAGVIGYPISHSKSPLIHGYWIGRYGLNARYDAVAIEPEHLKQGVQDLIAQGYAGFNVTIPHKETIMKLVADVDDTAARIGAVNTVVVGPDGRLHGRNTDAFGFAANLDAACGHGAFKGKTALVLGAGGAARACVYALRDMGLKHIHIAGRTMAKVEGLAGQFGADPHGWDDIQNLLPETDLLVNTTPLGMSGQPPLDIDLAGLKQQDAVVHDIVYVPLQTPLLKQAQDLGLRTVTGIGMLIHQARPAFEAWFGRMPDVDPMLEQLVLGGRHT